MHFFSKLGFLSVSMIFVATGCGKPSSIGDRNSYKKDPGLDYQVVGPLGEKVKELSENEYQEACDRKQLKTKLKLARVIDENSANIQAAILDPSRAPEGAKPISFVHSFLYEILRVKPEKEGWQSDTYSWRSLEKYYEKYRETPNQIHWRYFNSMVRSLVTDDELRIDYGRNMGIRFEHLPLLPKILNAIQECQKQFSCKVVSFDSESFKAVKEIPYYSYHESKLAQSKGHTEARASLDRFEKRVARDESLYRRSAYLQAIGNQTTHLEIRVPLADEIGLKPADQKIFEKAVQDAWNSETQKFFIDWLPASTRKNAVAGLQFGSEAGTRAHVNSNLNDGQPNYMRLFPYTRTTSIAHEFGHILGFNDHYFTVWNPERCEYDTYYNEHDIMSDSSSGLPTAEEREWIQLHYSPKPTASK